MDPEACLKRAAEALADGDHEECLFALQDYWEWRGKGGFEPAGGDTRAQELRLRVGAAHGWEEAPG